MCEVAEYNDSIKQRDFWHSAPCQNFWKSCAELWIEAFAIHLHAVLLFS
jgi:hypothetical protein